MPPRKLYFENVRVGDELPAMAKSPIDRVQLARYSGATGDFNPLYLDEAHAKSLGMPSVLAPNTLGMGFLGQLVSDWARGAQIRRMAVKFIRMVWPGDTLVCKGRVFDRWGQDGRYFLEVDVWAENQKGELAMRCSAQVKVFYSVEDENRFRTGQPPLIVNVARQSILAEPTPAAVESRSARKGKAPAKKAPAKKPAAKKSAAKKPAAKKAPAKKAPAKKAPAKKKPAAKKPAKGAKKKR